jgi:hypothetical protein
MQKAKDMLSPAIQKRRGLKVEPLGISTRTSHERLYGVPHGQELLDTYAERLRDNTLTPVHEQVAFRIDFAAWKGPASASADEGHPAPQECLVLQGPEQCSRRRLVHEPHLHLPVE